MGAYFCIETITKASAKFKQAPFESTPSSLVFTAGEPH